MLKRQQEALPASAAVPAEGTNRHSNMPRGRPSVCTQLSKMRRFSQEVRMKAHLEGLSDREAVERNPQVKRKRLKRSKFQGILNVSANCRTARVQNNISVRRKSERSPRRNNQRGSGLVYEPPAEGNLSKKGLLARRNVLIVNIAKHTKGCREKIVPGESHGSLTNFTMSVQILYSVDDSPY